MFVFCLAFLSSAFAQQTPTPVPTVPTYRMPCASDQDRVYIANRSDASIYETCYSVTSFSYGFNRLPFYMPDVQHIMPVSAQDFFALNYEKVHQVFGTQVSSWRVFSGGFAYNANAGNQPSISFRFPWQREGAQFWLDANGASRTKSLTGNDDPDMGCVSVAYASYKYCLDPSTWSLKQTVPGLFSSTEAVWFYNQQPVDMVAVGGKLYVALATKYNWYTDQNGNQVNSSELGKIVVLGFDKNGNFTEQTVIPNLDINPNFHERRLSATPKGLYFVSRWNSLDQQGQDVLWFYSFETQSVHGVVSSGANSSFSAIAAVSAASPRP